MLGGRKDVVNQYLEFGSECAPNPPTPSLTRRYWRQPTSATRGGAWPEEPDPARTDSERPVLEKKRRIHTQYQTPSRLVYNILSPTTAIIDYAIGFEELSANGPDRGQTLNDK